MADPEAGPRPRNGTLHAKAFGIDIEATGRDILLLVVIIAGFVAIGFLALREHEVRRDESAALLRLSENILVELRLANLFNSPERHGPTSK